MSNYNSKRDYVTQVQAAINAAGYSPALTVDGSYGPATTAGVRWYQAQKGLTVDGIIGDEVMAAIHGISASSPQPPAPGSPLAALAAQVAQLAAIQNAPVAPLAAPTPATVAAAKKVVTLLLPTKGVPPLAAPGGMTPAAVLTTIASPLMPSLAAGPLPPVGMTVVGAGIGSIIKLGLGTAIGGGIGLVAGLAVMLVAKHAAASAVSAVKAVAPSVTVHGEVSFGEEEDFDLELYEWLSGDQIVAGEIGMSMPMHTLKG